MTTLKTIAHIHSEFPSKFGIPRQSNLIENLPAAVVFTEEYRVWEALRGLETFSHIWLIWGFSEAARDTWSPTVRPPRLGGNTRMGVFATRSPYRPNPIGLSSVKIDRIERHTALGPVIHVLGGDLMDGTPIYDIKPYIPFVDSHPDADRGFAEDPPGPVLQVGDSGKWLNLLPPENRELLIDILAQDPRPSYQHDPHRVYGMEYAGVEVKFSVDGDILTVLEITRISCE